VGGFGGIPKAYRMRFSACRKGRRTAASAARRFSPNTFLLRFEVFRHVRFPLRGVRQSACRW
jgi:hypothetical protein